MLAVSESTFNLFLKFYINLSFNVFYSVSYYSAHMQWIISFGEEQYYTILAVAQVIY